MGKAGRIACIFTPFALTVASFVCLVFIEISGWSHSTLPSYYFMEANFTNLTFSGVSTAENTTTLTNALQQAQANDQLRAVYQIHLWNYCSSNGTDDNNETIDYCSKRHGNFVFDPVDVWGLNGTNITVTAQENNSSSLISSEVSNLKNATESREREILGDAGKDALDAYKKVAEWMFIAYEVAFWTTLATIVLSVFAIFSRWGSLFTWIMSGVSTAFNVAAVATSTALFGVLVGAFKTLLDPYGVELKLGTHALTVTWLSVVFSIFATLFWLFSVCCCSGSSNPHHRSNKGGLWNAEAKGQGYGDYGRGRGMRVEKTGGGYQRVASPFLGHAENEHGDRVPLQQYPHGGGAYEPFRHS